MTSGYSQIGTEWQSLAFWISLIDHVPRVPFMAVAHSISACFLVRRSASIRCPPVSFVLGLVVATFAANLQSLLAGGVIAVFGVPFLAPASAISWVAFNFSPFDVVFKLAGLLAPALGAADGCLAARDLMAGVDLAMPLY